VLKAGIEEDFHSLQEHDGQERFGKRLKVCDDGIVTPLLSGSSPESCFFLHKSRHWRMPKKPITVSQYCELAI
jgi:hypothetical protein